MRQRRGSRGNSAASRSRLSPAEGTSVGALLMGLGGFILGLFFGWLLQRDRVDRSTHDAAVGDRDRAMATLADTSARLELADSDIVGVRGQLTDARHLLDEREATIAQLTEELAACRSSASPDPALVDVRDPQTLEPFEAKEPPEVAPVDAPEALRAKQVEATDPLQVEQTEGTEPRADERAEASQPLAAAPSSEPIDAAADAATTPEMAQLFDDADITEEVFIDPPSAVPEPATAAEPDDLKRIVGVGPMLERMLHDHGITTFRQLALLDDDQVNELQLQLPRFSDRIRRGRWVEQARALHVDTHGDQP